MDIRTDLAVEMAGTLSQAEQLSGIKKEVRIEKDCDAKITDITILTDSASEKIGRPKGRYITIKALDGTLDSFSPCFDKRCQLIADLLKQLSGEPSSVLVAGLGNRRITADSLGPLCSDRIFATRHIKKYAHELDCHQLTELSVIETGVMGQTGVESAEQVRAICGAIRPELVVAVDALACWELDHLGRTIQLSSTGISPGSGVANDRSELSPSSLGIDCIAIGVPMVIDLSAAARRLFSSPVPTGAQGMTVTPGCADRLSSNCAEYIAMGINLAYQPSLTLPEIKSLIN